MKAANESKQTQVTQPRSRRAYLIICVSIFLLACGVRLLSWQDTQGEVGKVQTGVTADYQRVASLLRQGGIASFLSSDSPLSDLNTLGHPPGYSILIAIVHAVFGKSDAAIQFVQIMGDAFACVVIVLIVAELLPLGVAILGGTLSALSPQFAWNSVLLLPDSLAVLPILLAVYFLVRAIGNNRLSNFVIAGALIGVSCWLRANSMLLTFFVAAAVPLLILGERRWRYALAVVCGTLLIVLPLTIRNAVVFHRFIPLSLGAGQTLLEGIADYDREGKFGVPQTDAGIMRQEAEVFNRPDYYGTLFNPDGVERERARFARGFGIISSNPFWFAGVMTRRASTMLRLERSRLVSPELAVTHSFGAVENRLPVWTATAAELLANGTVTSSRTKIVLANGGQMLNLAADDSKYGRQFVSPPVAVSRNIDYVFEVPIAIDGRSRISVIGDGGKIHKSAIAESVEGKAAGQQPLLEVQLPFVASRDEPVRIVFSNEASIPESPVSQIGSISLYEVGPARFLWLRYPRFILHGIQEIFLTAIMLPLAIVGLALLVIKKRRRAWLVLTIVPIYFLCVQSIVHTEYRYVLVVDYFLFAFVGQAIVWLLNPMKSIATMFEKRRQG
jgi:hypothetical protein